MKGPPCLPASLDLTVCLPGWVSLVVNVTSGEPVGFKWRGGLPDSQSPVRLTTVGLGRPLILPTAQPTRCVHATSRPGPRS